MDVKIRCIGGFRDGNAFPRAIDNNEVLIVSEERFGYMQRSDPEAFELLEKIVPPPTKKAKKADKEDTE